MRIRAIALLILLLLAPSVGAQNVPVLATSATQSGTWTVQPGNTPNSTAWLVTGAGGTFPVTGPGGVFPVTDNGGSLTVDAPVGTPVFVRLSDGSSAISTLPVSLSSVPSHAVTNSGTFAVQAAQSGTWTIQPGNTANTTAWLVTGTGGTFPATQSGTWNITNVSGTISLPTGAATAANQATELTSLQLIDNLPNTIGSTTAGQSGVLALAATEFSAPSLSPGTSNGLSQQLDGSLRVAVTNGGGGGVALADNATFTDNSTNLTPSGGVAESSSPTACAEGKECTVRMTLARAYNVALVDSSGNYLTPGNDSTHNTAAITTGPTQMGRASAAAPTNVGADDRAVMAWHLLSGAYVTQPSFAGVLATTGNGVSGTGVQRVTIASDSTGVVGLATGSNTIGALTANQSVNISQMNGVTTTMGNGASGTGVQRVTIASDSTGVVGLATGSNTIGALTANQSVNISQMNGVATTMGNGASGTGVQRVTIASDSTGVVGLATGSNTIGALSANQTVNVAQVNGVTTTMGNGASGTGVQRVTIASDSTGQVALAAGTAVAGYFSEAATATTTNSGSECVIVSAASTNSNSCKGSAGNFYGFDLFNTTVTTYYLRLYNSSSAPTCSSATGFIRSVPIPPASGSGQVGGVVRLLTLPIGYGTGIGYCLTGGSSSTDNTNAATGVFGSIYFK